MKQRKLRRGSKHHRDSTDGAAGTRTGTPLPASGSEARPGSSGAFPIVAVGASAGGLEAFSQLLAHLPADSGMAFVFIQHLDPTHKSYLREALSKATRMPVHQATEGVVIQPDHVYVIPQDADLSVGEGILALVPRPHDATRLHLPIDVFFRALAVDRGTSAIGVVLSGTACDGTEGLKAIKAEGGITFAQDPKTAKFGGMPRSAIDSGYVDYTLLLPELAGELVRLSRHPYLAAAEEERPPADDETALAKIVKLIKTIAGLDFSEYKLPTFERRLARRMAIRGVESREAYVSLLQRDPDEVRELSEETLIHVSSFFRDPEVFQELKERLFPAILKQKEQGAPIRIWVAGCSTGEEVYSLAITLLEVLADHPEAHSVPIQIFGSDVSENAVHIARGGRYADGAMRGISDEQRRRFFNKVDGGYRINKTVRELCVFVRHDLTCDPPFSKLDLLSCRNVLIYFDSALQKRVLATFHYSLNQPGYLLLGSTEHVSGFARLFSLVDRRSRIFQRSAAASNLRFPRRTEAPREGVVLAQAGADSRPAVDVGRHLDSLMLARYAPPGVLVNDKLEILQFRGQTGAYLQPAPGEPQSNVVKMARAGLLPKLREALVRAKREMAPVQMENVEVDQGGFTRTCNIVVIPFTGLPEVKERLFVVLFEEIQPEPERNRPGRKSRRGTRRISVAVRDAQRLRKLEHELSSTTEYLHSLLEEHSRTNDDLGSANEELVSGNEELQSLNEELETAKEELQSTNEELTTVNDELHSRNQELGEANSDLVNVLTAVDVPVLILDRQRRIRRFTPHARSILNVVPSDVGRLLDDIRPNIDAPDLDRQIQEVTATAVPREAEVRDREGRWYRMKIRPYHAADGSVDGSIVTLFDIDALKHHVNEAERAKELAERADQAKDEFLAILSHELRTPLSALLLQTNLLGRAGSDAVRIERARHSIERSARTQAQLIDDLLDMSGIVTGKLKVDLRPVDLDAIIVAALEGVAATAESKSVTLKTVLHPSLGPVRGDRVRLEQVVSNLLTNAIKFTPSGGSVTVTLDTVGDQAHIGISDTGMGIEPSFLPRVFNRFSQADTSTTRPQGGLGLGLAIVRHLIDEHGGAVRAESPGPGKGATFHVTLPFMPVQVESQSDLSARSPARPTNGERVALVRGLLNRRILVVEDDGDTRDALAEMLTDMGATVTTADSAAQALAMVGKLRPHVILCDIAMPAEDGYSFIRRLRAGDAASGGDTPALALTAMVGDADRRRALSEGFQMHMAKPIDADRLARAIVELAEAARSVPAGPLPTLPNDLH